MVRILEILSKRHLELLSQRLTGEEQTEYKKALYDMRSNSVSMERVREAEAIVMKTANRFGKVLIFGDQLTVIRNIYFCFTLFAKYINEACTLIYHHP